MSVKPASFRFRFRFRAWAWVAMARVRVMAGLLGGWVSSLIAGRVPRRSPGIGVVRFRAGFARGERGSCPGWGRGASTVADDGDGAGNFGWELNASAIARVGSAEPAKAGRAASEGGRGSRAFAIFRRSISRETGTRRLRPGGSPPGPRNG